MRKIIALSENNMDNQQLKNKHLFDNVLFPIIEDIYMKSDKVYLTLFWEAGIVVDAVIDSIGESEDQYEQSCMSIVVNMIDIKSIANNDVEEGLFGFTLKSGEYNELYYDNIPDKITYQGKVIWDITSY